MLYNKSPGVTDRHAGQPDIARVSGYLPLRDLATSLAEANDDFPQSFRAIAGVVPSAEPRRTPVYVQVHPSATICRDLSDCVSLNLVSMASIVTVL